MPFIPVSKVTIVDQIADTIRRAIINGDYQPGESLPSERVLATRFAANRTSTREALVRLEAQKLVSIRQGGATRVLDPFGEAGLGILPYLLAPEGDVDWDLLKDTLDIRVLLLGWTAAQATLNKPAAGGIPSQTRLYEERIADLHKALHDLEFAADPEQALRADWSWFETLVALGGNRVITLIVNGLRPIYFRNVPLLAFLYQGLPYDVSEHHAALVAIQAGDAPAAQEAMTRYGRRFLNIAPLGSGTP